MCKIQKIPGIRENQKKKERKEKKEKKEKTLRPVYFIADIIRRSWRYPLKSNAALSHQFVLQHSRYGEITHTE